MKKKIQITTSSFADLDKTPMELLKSSGYVIVDNPYRRKVTTEELLGLLDQDVTGLIAGLELLNREVLEKSNLKVISRVGAGMSNVDLRAADELGITVCSTPDGPTLAVAEQTVGAMLSLIRMSHRMDRDLHQGKWNKMIGFQLNGKKILIIGFGRIGRKVAELLDSFGVHIYVADPLYKNDVEGCLSVSLEQGLRVADIITIHSSGEDCILGDTEFTLLKKGVFLLNAARGGVISESALMNGLRNGNVGGAWLDTFEKEPYNGELTSLDNVMLTPHIGSYTYECRKKMEMDAVENLLNALRHR